MPKQQLLILLVSDGKAASATLRDADGRELTAVFNIDLDIAAIDVASPRAFAEIAEPIRQQLAHHVRP